jgi:hypothetical protein
MRQDRNCEETEAEKGNKNAGRKKGEASDFKK